MCQVCGQEQPMLCPLCEDLTWPMLSCHLQFNRVFTDVRPCVGICSMISAFSQAGLARCFGLRQHPAEPILRRPRAPRTSLPTCAGPAAQSPAAPAQLLKEHGAWSSGAVFQPALTAYARIGNSMPWKPGSRWHILGSAIPCPMHAPAGHHVCP